MRIPILPAPQRALKIPADPENFGVFGGEWSGVCLYYRVQSNPKVPYTKFSRILRNRSDVKFESSHASAVIARRAPGTAYFEVLVERH